MAILVDEHSRILIQGITGSTGRAFARRMIEHGTPLVGGVSPGKSGQCVEGVPVYGSMREAVAATQANAVLSAVGGPHALDAVFEVAEAGIALMVLYTENVPVHDAIKMRAAMRACGTRLLGPNSAGVVTPGKANIADLNDLNVRPGRIGIVSKSGTLTYEVIDQLHELGLGESTVVCLGGDRIVGTTYIDVLPLFEADEGTDAVVLIGEPGGRLEYGAAAMARAMRKPVMAYVTAQYAPPEKRLGHAGAIGKTPGAGESAAEKLNAFREAGCETARLLSEVGSAVERMLDRVVRNRRPRA